jgi:hypothetical protein
MTYDTDFVAWTEEQAAILKDVDPVPPGLDIENLVDEILGLGRREIAAASDLVERLMVTLIKLSETPDSPDASAWVEEALLTQGLAIIACEAGVGQHVYLPEFWRRAALTSKSMQYETVPDDCPLVIEDLLDIDFDPVAAARKISAAAAPSP